MLTASAEPLLAAIVESSTDAIVARDLSGTITIWNESAVELFGWAGDDVIGQSVEILIPPERRADERLILARVVGGERVRSYATKRVHRDGRVLDVSLSLSPIFDDAGEVVGAAGIERDVSMWLGYDRERTRLIAELQRSNADLEQFAYVASHDLSEPLRAVAGMVDLLARRYKDDLDETAHDYIQRAVAGTQRMERLINDLLMYSRAGRTALALERVDSVKVVGTALEALGPALLESDAHVDVGELPTLVVDATKLAQVFQNLLANAIKFSGEGPPRVRVSATESADGWEFTVADDGIGIEERHRERIFKIFQRLHGRAEYEGTGIGLALSKRLVEAHGGDLWVGDAGPPGTEFHFTIPNREESP